MTFTLKEEFLDTCHPQQMEFLQRVISSEKIPHAFLFSGVRGIGKTTAAFHFAKMLLSVGAELPVQEQADQGFDLFGSPEPSAKTESSSNGISPEVDKKVHSGTHLDLFILEKKSDNKNIGIDEVRGLGKFLSLTPAESKYRVAIINSIDDFNINSSNAVLKILEEPTRNTVLIIICHSRINLLPTIKSRCIELKFHPFNKTNFDLILKNHSYEKSNFKGLYELSEGSPGNAAMIIESKAHDTLNRYLAALQKNIVSISEITSIAKEIKENDSWKIFGNLFAKSYMENLSGNYESKKLDTISEINKIIYMSEFQNMDIQDTLKHLTHYINQYN